jgi:hypothetical protein
MKRRVAQNTDYAYFNSAKLSVNFAKLSEKFHFFNFLVSPAGGEAFKYSFRSFASF